MKYILYVYEQGQLPGLEVWGALGVKLQVLQLRAWFSCCLHLLGLAEEGI